MRNFSQVMVNITFFASLMTLALGFAMVFFQYNRKTYPGYKYWITATFLNSIGAFLISIRNDSPDIITIIMGNINLLLFYIFVFTGIEKFAGTRSRATGINLAILAIMSGLFMYYTFYAPDMNTRIIIFSLAVTGVSLTGIFTSMALFKKNTHCRDNMLSVSLYIIVTWYLLRTIIHIILPYGILPDFINMKTMNIACVSIIVVSNIFTIISLIILTTESLSNDLSVMNRKLAKTLSEVKELRGLLPICRYCKKIMNDEGDYEAVESYLESHTDINFSHTLCDECAEKVYPEYKDKLRQLKYDKKP